METPYELLIRYYRKETTPEEEVQVKNWLSEDDNLSLFLDLKKEWRYLDDHSMVSPDKQLTWKKIEAKTTSINKQKIQLYKIFRIAAAACLLIALSVSASYFIFKSPTINDIPLEYASILTRSNEKSTIVLSDGTSVSLNSNSSLIFANNYNTDIREVTAKGELYFEVKPGDKKFVLNVGKIKVEVLGTSFSVKMDEINNITEIALKEGKISIVEAGSNKQLFVMNPIQHAVINDSDLTYKIELKDSFPYNIWTQQSVSMHNEALIHIFEKLENWYGIEINSNGLDMNKHYTFNLQSETLTEFLDLFSIITPIKYTISDNKVYIENREID